MKKEFWLERWQKQEIGFHQDEINPYLSQYWPALNLATRSEVFVPMCGKSRDMLWLREQGHSVLGVELSKIAVSAFFAENGYTPSYVHTGKFDSCSANEISLLCGDFFDMTPANVEQVTAVYDRASLVALPVEMRERYAKHLFGILPPATQILLVTFDYRQAEMQGPPFAVSPDEVRSLYRQAADIRMLAQLDVLQENQHFKSRGLTGLQENIFLLTI